ncbi:vitamin B12 dependent-methionine synthase activation domain-containing protein [Gaoshiqia sp. Z1-71]|uniref:vitamin B12 dependent-methionine synthase activation domain-containing protein n=1 Tax=Gaoshiqia hydrogeniformans TaxID=3290090 RepID=UPI003BF7EDAA
MTREFSFCFDELNIDRLGLIRLLGYDESFFPDPFPAYLEQAFAFAAGLNDIGGAFRLVDRIAWGENKRSVRVNGQEFNVGKTVVGELKGAARLAFFVCTAGKTVSEKSEQLLKGDDPVLGYVYDVLGTLIAEAAGDRLQEIVRDEADGNHEQITNRYSPGYCHWPVSDQHKLFSLLGQSPCGVQLTPSSLMYPVKSISGLIGIGRHVEFHDYQCTLCEMEHCFYREVHRV